MWLLNEWLTTEEIIDLDVQISSNSDQIETTANTRVFDGETGVMKLKESIREVFESSKEISSQN